MVGRVATRNVRLSRELRPTSRLSTAELLEEIAPPERRDEQWVADEGVEAVDIAKVLRDRQVATTSDAAPGTRDDRHDGGPSLGVAGLSPFLKTESLQRFLAGHALNVAPWRIGWKLERRTAAE